MLGAMGRPRWTAGDLAGATPEVVAAARWELYVHRVWPAAAADQLAGPDKPLKEAEQQRARREARTALNGLRRLLTLADEPDEPTLPELPDVPTTADIEDLIRSIAEVVH